MVEFNWKHTQFPQDWKTLHPSFECPDDFDEYDYRIDGIVYTERTEEFVKAFKDAKVWQILQYNSNKGRQNG